MNAQRTIHFNFVFHPWKPLFPIMDHARRIDEISNIWVVFVLCEKEREEVLVEAHDEFVDGVALEEGDLNLGKWMDCGVCQGLSPVISRHSPLAEVIDARLRACGCVSPSCGLEEVQVHKLLVYCCSLKTCTVKIE